MEQNICTQPEITATKQAVSGRDSRGRFVRGNAPKTGFHTNPERRSNGSWKKERTVRGKLEKILEDVTISEFFEQIAKNNVAFLDEKAGDIFVSQRLRNIFKISKDGRIEVISREFDKLMKFIYGNKVEHNYNAPSERGGAIITNYIVPTIDPKVIEAHEKDIRGKIS